MKLYFGNAITTVTTLMLLALLGFIGWSVLNRTSIQYWGRRSTILLIIVAAIATPIAGTQKMREIWFYVMSSGAVLKIATMEIARVIFLR